MAFRLLATSFWLAMTGFFVCLLFGWQTAAAVVGAAYLALLVLVSVVGGVRMVRGSTWKDAWGWLGRD